VETRNEGDSVWIHQSKKMKWLTPYANDFLVRAEVKDDNPIGTSSIVMNDSSLIILVPEDRLFYKVMILLSYSGTKEKSANGGLLETFVSVFLSNIVDGYHPIIVKTRVGKSGASYHLYRQYFR